MTTGPGVTPAPHSLCHSKSALTVWHIIESQCTPYATLSLLCFILTLSNCPFLLCLNPPLLLFSSVTQGQGLLQLSARQPLWRRFIRYALYMLTATDTNPSFQSPLHGNTRYMSSASSPPDRKSTRLNSSHLRASRMPSSA